MYTHNVYKRKCCTTCQLKASERSRLRLSSHFRLTNNNTKASQHSQEEGEYPKSDRIRVTYWYYQSIACSTTCSLHMSFISGFSALSHVPRCSRLRRCFRVAHVQSMALANISPPAAMNVICVTCLPHPSHRADARSQSARLLMFFARERVVRCTMSSVQYGE